METPITPLTQGAAGSVPHIHQLPIELFQHLLHLAVAEIRHGNRPWSVYSRIVKLRLVCTRWLAVIDSHPSFWTLLTNRLSPSLISIVLEKSGTLPLDVDLHGTTSGNNPPPLHYMNIMTSLAERWRSLNIVWYHPELKEALRNLLLTPAPQLKAFSCNLSDDILAKSSLFDDMAPNLDSISLRYVLPNWNSLLMNGLRKLAVIGVSVDVRDFEGLIQALVASPNMEELVVSAWTNQEETLLGEPSFKLEPIVLDSLRLFTLCALPSTWDHKLLEAIRIPQRCAVVIELGLGPSPQPPLSNRMKQLQARIAGSSLLKVEFGAYEGYSRADYKCHGTDGVGDTSISLGYTEMGLQPSGAFQLWLSSLAEITESVQTSGIPVHITISSNIPLHSGSPDTLTSTLRSVDELLPSVCKASFSGRSIPQFLSYASSPSFPNLSDLEVKEVAIPWKEILECVEARSELATFQGWKFKPLRSISLTRGPINEEVYKRLSTLVENIYRHISKWHSQQTGIRNGPDSLSLLCKTQYRFEFW